MVCFSCSPWPCRQHTPVLQTCLGSFSPVCEQSWAQLLPGAPPGTCAQLCRCCRLPVCLRHGLGSSKPNCIIGRINANWCFSNCNFACVVFFWIPFVPLAAPGSRPGLGALCCRVGTCLAPSPSRFSCWWRIRAQYPVLAKDPGSSLHWKGLAGASQLLSTQSLGDGHCHHCWSHPASGAGQGCSEPDAALKPVCVSKAHLGLKSTLFFSKHLFQGNRVPAQPCQLSDQAAAQWRAEPACPRPSPCLPQLPFTAAVGSPVHPVIHFGGQSLQVKPFTEW